MRPGVWLLLACISGASAQYRVNNDFVRDAFPGTVSQKSFSIRLSPKTLAVVYPAVAEKSVPHMRDLLRQKCGREIPFLNAGVANEQTLRSRDLIVLGNLSNNPLALALYKRRYAFADAYFPGRGGVAIHPAKSLWSREHNVLVIGVSADSDTAAGFESFVALLPDGASSIGPLRQLKTSLAFPRPPASVAPLLENARMHPHTAMAPYGTIANWGLAYHLTGDRTWAGYFLDGFRLCYQRAEKTGQWISEPWTNVYFNLWKMVYAWELIDDDPIFTPTDRKLIDEVLWGYAHFSDWLPNLDPDMAPPDEPRQNHTTFLALSLYYAHRHLTRCGVTGLDSFVTKYHRAFEHGEASSYRPNDDAGGYLFLAPLHLLTYEMAENQDSFAAGGKLRQLADVVFTILDNRGDPVSFGDVGGYSHRGPGSRRGPEASFFGMAAWRYRDPEYAWLYRWNTQSLSFSLEELYTGSYATDMETREPKELFGVHPVLLDDAALRWSARRSDRKEDLPLKGVRYLDKLSFRPDLSPNSEYLLLDGTSTFSHGHEDGNTVTRLTWKDRVWLFESDYIKLTPKYHMGVVVTRNGVQDPPPPLTALDFDGELGGYGFSRCTVRDYNGCDWARNIVWRKGKYFFFLDEVRARLEGAYRLESRWRSLGEARLDGSQFSVRQGDSTFHIVSGDDAERSLVYEPGPSNYPGAGGRTAIDYARKEVTLAPRGRYAFANLMAVDSASAAEPLELRPAGQRSYALGAGTEQALAGTSAGVLASGGVFADAALFVLDSQRLLLMNATSARLGEATIEASAPVHVEIEYGGSRGTLVVPSGEVSVRVQHVRLAGQDAAKLKAGRYTFSVTAPLPDLARYLGGAGRVARPVTPAAPPRPTADFGFSASLEVAATAPVTSFSNAGDDLLYGDRDGKIRRIHEKAVAPVTAIASGRPVTVIHSADIDGDGRREILAGDDAQNVYCYSADGKPLWNHKLTGYYGRANPTSISTADLDGSGRPAVLVTTTAWKLYAFNGDGTIRWEAFTKYHPQTMARFLKGGDGGYVAVGTTYETPLNVLSARDGRLLWYTWEEMGSEFLATTQYCGIHLTDMLVLDVDGDGREDIVFGTKSNAVYALDSANGATKWQANVGGEVNALRTAIDAGSGEPRILVATDGGDVFEYDRRGRRLRSLHLESAITDVAVIPYAAHQRNDVVLSTRNGSVIVCDGSFRIRAAWSRDDRPWMGIRLGAVSNGQRTIYAVTEKGIQVLDYRPFFLRDSRNY